MYELSMLLAQADQQLGERPDPLTLCLGDWGAWNPIRPFAFLVIFLVFLTPIPCFGGYNLMQLLNLLLFPFWLNDKLNK